jgi:hypothetical protein
MVQGKFALQPTELGPPATATLTAAPSGMLVLTVIVRAFMSALIFRLSM